jgi:hypothetical protein
MLVTDGAEQVSKAMPVKVDAAGAAAGTAEAGTRAVDGLLGLAVAPAAGGTSNANAVTAQVRPTRPTRLNPCTGCPSTSGRLLPTLAPDSAAREGYRVKVGQTPEDSGQKD